MGKIRIIAGIYRRRQLTVLDADGLRPTLDRVKETVFNWLGQDLTGLKCLDLFAGSGSLGFEALSRNAAQVIMLETNPQIAQQLRINLELLDAKNGQVYQQDALKYLRSCSLTFDVIFVDPPYDSNLLEACLAGLEPLLTTNGVFLHPSTNKPSVGLERSIIIITQ